MAAHGTLIYKCNHIFIRDRETGEVGREYGRIETEIDVEIVCAPGVWGTETERESGKETDGDGGSEDREREEGKKRGRAGKEREIETENLDSVCHHPPDDLIPGETPG